MPDIADLMQTDGEGRGVVNVLAADKLYNNPKLYSTFLLWMLSELFEQLPEVGDVEKPKLVPTLAVLWMSYYSDVPDLAAVKPTV